ncbi:MAG: HEAT repeat domain-containing protein [Planctomycetota bacterium]|jgi:hypothetical protein
MWKRAGAIGLLLVVIAVGVVAFFSSGAKITGEGPDQRIESIVRLANERPRGAADALAEAAVSDPVPSVRRAAVAALGGFAREEDRAVIESATQDSDPGVRQTAVRLLATTYEDESTIDRVAEMADSDADPQARQAAVDVLADSDEAYAIVRLIQAMEAAPLESRRSLLTAVRQRFGILQDVDCADDDQWARLVVSLKDSDEIAAAFEQVGEPLNQDEAILQQIIDDHAAGCHADNPPPSDASHGGPRP